jgi:hypothetical protein
MSNGQRLKMHAGDRLIDAEFTIAVTSPQNFEITLESSGGSTGGRNARNSEYSLGLTELLRRSEQIASTLDDCLVVSRVARSLPEEQRRVIPSAPYAYPIALTASEDFERLRLALTSPQVHIASKATSGGNMRKNILLRFTSRQLNITRDAIEFALDAVPTDTRKRDRKDIAAGISKADIDAARQEWREMGSDAFHRKYGTTRAAKFVIADPDGTEYDAKAILFGARIIAGLDGENADFDGDMRTVAQPLQALGYIVEDITAAHDDDAESDATASEEARRRAIQQARDFAGEIDTTAERKVRREQRLLRKALGLGKGSHTCALCGRTYPDRLLVAAHIKKRSDCTDQEKVDIPAVAMIACALGCDALFEHGYIVVNSEGLIESTIRSDGDSHLSEMVEMLQGRRVTDLNIESAPYFDWHRRNHVDSDEVDV